MKILRHAFILFFGFYGYVVHAQAPYILWEQSYGGSNRDEANSIQQTRDGGYIIAGWTSSSDGEVISYHGGNSDFWIVKLSSTDTIQWEKSLGGLGYDAAESIRQTSDGGYIVVGYTNSTDGDMMGDNILIPGPSPRERGGTAVVDLSGYSKGVYFYRVTDQGNTIGEGKMVLE